MDHGLVIAEGTPDELKGQIGGDRLEIRLDATGNAEAGIAALAPLAQEPPVLEDGLLRVPLRARRGAIADAVRRLDSAGVGIDDIALRGATLDDVFLNLTGHRAAAADEQGEGVESG